MIGRKTLGRVLAALALLAGIPAPAGAEAGPPASVCRDGASLLPRLRGEGALARIEAEAAAEPNGTGRFWRIEKQGLPPSFLFGTMHLSDPRVLSRPAPVEAALAQAHTVAIETLDILGGGADMLALAHPELLTLAPGRTLDDYLRPDERRELEGLLRDGGPPYASIRTLQPWFTAMGMMLPPCEAARMAGGAQALDVEIAQDAKAAGKELVGLESALDQLRVMASMPMELQTANLVSVLKLKEAMPDLFETMIELYLDGRIAAIGPLSDVAGGLDDMPEKARDAYDAFERRIVVDRNHGMAKGLEPHLAGGGVFVAVGALHLPGREGLVELLRAGGYRVSRAD